MPNSRLKTVRDEFLTSIDHYEGFHVNLRFDRFLIDRCAHIWVSSTSNMVSGATMYHHELKDTQSID